MKNFKFRLRRSIALKLSLKANEDERKKKTNFRYSTLFPGNEEREFAIEYKIKICTPECKLKLVFVSFFETTEDITEEQKNESKFFNINAPAIGYPFLRAYVANLMISSGYNPIMLPTVNFQKLADESDEVKALENKNRPEEKKLS